MKKKDNNDFNEIIVESTATGFKQFNPQIGKHVRYVNSVQKVTIGEEAANEQLRKSYEIMSCCNHKDAAKDTTNQGVVVGKVQSGKTNNFATVSAFAADNGYKVIIHILGTTHTLKDSNFVSIDETLGLSDEKAVPSLDWHPVGVGFKGGKGTDFRNYGIDVPIESLVAMVNSSGGSMMRTNNTKVLYFYLLKNKAPLQKMQNLISHLAQSIGTNHQMPVLIIDDEVDSYSPNTAKPGKKVKPIYAALKKLKADSATRGGGVTYIGYTATAQAISLAHSSSFLKPTFHAVLNSGKGYVGNKEMFGVSPSVLTQRELNSGINDRNQPKTITVIDPLTESFDPRLMTETLMRSVADFLISSVFLKERSSKNVNPDKSKEDSFAASMMLLENTTNANHDHWESELDDILQKFLAVLSAIKQNPSKQAPGNAKYLIDAYAQRKIESNSKLPQPSLKLCYEMIHSVLLTNDFKIVKLNQDGPAKVITTTKALWFWIGGLKLGRGFVVPELLTTWFPMQPKKLTVDVTEQRGRFFGYKSSYFDLISVYLQEDSLELLRSYSSEEEVFHAELKDMAIEGLDLASYDTNWTTFDRFFALTASNKNHSGLKRVTSKWHTTLYSPFEDLNGAPAHNQKYKNVVDTFLTNNLQHLADIGDNNKYGCKTDSNEPSFCKIGRFRLEDIYNSMLKPLKGTLNPNDKTLRQLITTINSQYLRRLGGHDIDVVFFPNKGKTRGNMLSEFSNSTRGWYFPSWGYKQGSDSKGRLKGYVGDDSVIVGDNFQPRIDFDNDKNTTFTLQIHEIEKITHHSNTPQNIKNIPIPRNFYAVRVLAPYLPSKGYIL